MAEVTKAALANRTKQVTFWGCCCHSVVLASDYVQAAAVKLTMCKQRLLNPFTLRITGSVSVHASCACVSKLVHPQLQRARQPVVCPCTGERAECSLCDGHAMTNASVVSVVSFVSAATLHSRPQILERVDVLERSIADVHLAQQRLGSTPLCSLRSSIGQRVST